MARISGKWPLNLLGVSEVVSAIEFCPFCDAPDVGVDHPLCDCPALTVINDAVRGSVPGVSFDDKQGFLCALFADNSLAGNRTIHIRFVGKRLDAAMGRYLRRSSTEFYEKREDEPAIIREIDALIVAAAV